MHFPLQGTTVLYLYRKVENNQNVVFDVIRYRPKYAQYLGLKTRKYAMR